MRGKKITFLAMRKAPQFVINDADAVFDVANVLWAALEADPPYVFGIKDTDGTYRQVTNNREELLEHYMEWAMHELYNLIEDKID